MHKIIIIGTEPPCPRCGLLTKVLKVKIDELSILAEIEHWNFTDTKSKLFAEDKGLIPGTAKDVAAKTGIEIDKTQLAKLIQNPGINPDNEFRKYNNFKWSPELDEFLLPLERKAESAGFLMTPTLIINGAIKHSGSVPAMEKITKWLQELLSN